MGVLHEDDELEDYKRGSKSSDSSSSNESNRDKYNLNNVGARADAVKSGLGTNGGHKKAKRHMEIDASVRV